MLHEHHRDRLREKAIKDISVLNEYELLELILFGAIPRRNTNDVAHRLIDEFGSIRSVFAASPETLMKVEGIGPTTAAHIAAMNCALNAISEKEDEFPTDFSFSSIKQPLVDYYKRFKEEVFIVFFLDKKQRILSRKAIYGHSAVQVDIDLNDLARQLILIKPAYIAVAHNHLSGNVSPSADDDVATQKLSMVASLNGASLVDHLIVCGDKIYSYYYDNRLEKINKKVREALG